MRLGKRIWKREEMGRPIEHVWWEGGRELILRKDHYSKDGGEETGEELVKKQNCVHMKILLFLFCILIKNCQNAFDTSNILNI